jgi:CO/xanthine dehydrogenase FAD-binding subunit
MVGAEPDDSMLAEVAAEASRAVEPSSSVHGSAEYRRGMVAIVVKRVLAAAARRARPVGEA